jgi:hypothetical protein
VVGGEASGRREAGGGGGRPVARAQASEGRPPGSMEASERGKGTTNLPLDQSPDGKRFPFFFAGTHYLTILSVMWE